MTQRASIKVDNSTLQALKAEQGRRMTSNGESWSMDRLINALLKEARLMRTAMRTALKEEES